MQHVGDRAEHEHTRRAHATSTPHSQCTPRCPARMPRGVCTRAKPSRLGHHRACTCAVPACDNDAAPGQAARPRDCRTAAARSWVRPLERQTLGSDICRGKCKSGCTRESGIVHAGPPRRPVGSLCQDSSLFHATAARATSIDCSLSALLTRVTVFGAPRHGRRIKKYLPSTMAAAVAR